MKTYLLISLLLLCVNLNAAHYYFSTSTGNDSRSSTEAQNNVTPWKSINKLNAFFNQLKPGDSVLFKRGDVFYGSVIVSVSGNTTAPITLSAYGTGPQPMISGFTKLSGWSPRGTNIFETSDASLNTSANMVLVNNVSKVKGRYPNITSPNKGYLSFESAIATTAIVDSKLAGLDFSGGEVVIRKNRWVLDRNKILQHTGSMLTYASQSGYGADKGFGYFIQNHSSALDEDGEWYYKADTKSLGIYTKAGEQSLQNVQVATIQVLVMLENQSHITFDNLTFSGSNDHTFFLQNAKQVQINNCDLLYNGRNGITANNIDGLKIENTTIHQTNNIAFSGQACSNTIFKNNTITATGIWPGMGEGDSGSYEAIMLSGDNNLIQQNRVDSTGYIPITFSGNNVTIKNNYISNYALVKDDGGGIYTWNNTANALVNVNRIVKGNIVMNGLGAGEGTSDPSKKLAHGIYIDDNATNVSIDGNTVANCASFGVYVHNARNLTITNNTIYNNRAQLVMQHDDIAPNSPVVNNTVTDNILFSLSANQPVAEYKSNKNDLAGFGNFDNNYYCRPIDENAVINTLSRSNGVFESKQLDVDGWKALYGKDTHSKITSRQISPFTIEQVTGTNKFTNGAFNSNIGGLYAFSPASNCITGFNNGALDGGTLQVSFPNISGSANNKGSVIIGIGNIKAGKQYLLSFSLKGATSNRMLECYLRKSLAPYNDITARQLVKVRILRKEVTLLFIPAESQKDASIGIDFPEQRDAVYLDNIQLMQVRAAMATVQDSVLYLDNASTSAKTFTLGNIYVDARNVKYRGRISLGAYSSAILMQAPSVKPLILMPQAEQAKGTILYEQWVGVGGNNLPFSNFNNKPDVSNQLNLFEAPVDVNDNYASRIRGYVEAPVSGNYIFYIAGDDATELYLSPNTDPVNKKRIAYNLCWTNGREWNKYASQRSIPITLVAGKKYYVEALHKEGEGGDNLAVAWQLPTGLLEGPIPGNRLSPFIEKSVLKFKPSTNSEGKTIINQSNDALKILPNPLVNNGKILITAAVTGNTRITLQDTEGKVMKRLFNANMKAGDQYLLPMNVSYLPGGIYIVKMETKLGTTNQKVVITH